MASQNVMIGWKDKVLATKWIWVCFQCLLGGVLIVWIIKSTEVNRDQIISRLGNASLVDLLIGILFFLLAMGFGAYRYKLILRIDLPYKYLFGISLFQNFLLTLIPWRMGEVGYPLLLWRDYKISIKDSSVIILMIRLVDLLIIASVPVWLGRNLNLVLDQDKLLVSGMVGFLAVVLIGLLILKYRNWIKSQLLIVVAAFKHILNIKRAILLLVLSILIFLSTTLQSMFILRAIGLLITLPDIALINSLTLITALVPIHPPGGWGTIDIVQITLLKILGYPALSSVAIILSAHVIYTILISFGGAIGWLIRVRYRPSLENGSMN